MEHMNESLKETIAAFLRNRSVSELAYRCEPYNCILLRSRYDDETDFLYLLSQYGNEDAHHYDASPTYAGIFSHVKDVLVAASYDLRDLCDERWRASAILENFAEQVKKRVLELTDGKPVPVTKDADEIHFDKEYFLRYEADQRARDFFYSGQSVSYMPCIQMGRPNTRDFIRMVNHPEEAAAQYAEAYVRKNANAINNGLWRAEIVAEKLNKLKKTPGDHHLRLRIAQALTTQKMVRIDVDKEGKQLSLRIAADVLKRANDTDYALWHLDAQSRDLFESTYGRSARLFASDIARITYSRVTLYEKAAS